MDVTDSSCFGTTAFGEPDPVELATTNDPNRTIKVIRQRGGWSPSEHIAAFLPERFSVPLECYTADDGLRRIVPQCNFEELIDLGAVGGLAVIHGLRGFDPAVDHSYRAMFLIHQHVRGRMYGNTRGMKEHLTRQFAYSRDLYLRLSARLSGNDRDVLPEDLSQDRGTLSVTQLTKLGREAADDAGVTNPTSQRTITFGLYELAKRNPLQVAPDEVTELVRMSLFNVDSVSVPSPEVVDIVAERLLAATHAHLADPQADFDWWFCGSDNSVVKQIAKQKKAHGGELGREEVRQALLHIGWQAYGYVGQSLHALMRTIKNSTSPSLSEDEQRLFEHMYESQPYYGGFPAALLAERMSFLKRAVLGIWQEPHNPEHVGVLHRLLACYAEMAAARRAADLRSKTARSKAKRGEAADDVATAGVSRTEPVPRDRAAHPRRLAGELNEMTAERQELTPFQAIAEYLRERNKIMCPSGCQNWECWLEDQTAELLRIRMRCGCGRCRRLIEMPAEEFVAEAEIVLGWPRLATSHGQDKG